VRGRPVTCCFTGHRPTKLPWGENESDPRCLSLRQKLRAAVESAYEEGFRHFICGMAQGCDFFFAEEILSLKEQREGVTLEAAIPCPSQADNWSAADRTRYLEILARCDYETLVQDHYSPGCMQRRNRYMVDHSSLVIAVYNGQNGGTRRTLEYAISQKVPFVDIRTEE